MTSAALEVNVRVIPKARRTAVDGMRGGSVLIRLAASPVEGAANDLLVEFLAGLFERPRRDVTIVAGHTSRDKRVRIDGVTDAEGRVRLSTILSG
ncbi:MAG: DUF167 domain-containing protein [Acidobacteria bacterium]|nr:DUF167 domain-containing protein [Acidobacteriota bacterium]MCA1651176.1 DUF167 domain-containing protein [Acidobacteriota bacterium]